MQRFKWLVMLLPTVSWADYLPVQPHDVIGRSGPPGVDTLQMTIEIDVGPYHSIVIQEDGTIGMPAGAGVNPFAAGINSQGAPAWPETDTGLLLDEIFAFGFPFEDDLNETNIADHFPLDPSSDFPKSLDLALDLNFETNIADLANPSLSFLPNPDIIVGSSPVVLPEPNTLALFAAGILGICVARRRRNQTH